MSLEDGEPKAPSLEGKREFSAEIEVEGLTYILKGEVSPKEKKASISLHIPNWQKEITDLKAAGVMSSSQLQNEGEIGSVDLTPSQRDDADVYFGKIRAYSHHLVETSPYFAAHVGRALMNNILAIADANGWRVEAFANADGRLFDNDIIAWLQRKGFQETDRDFVRQPQTPDATQPVLRLLGE